MRRTLITLTFVFATFGLIIGCATLFPAPPPTTPPPTPAVQATPRVAPTAAVVRTPSRTAAPTLPPTATPTPTATLPTVLCPPEEQRAPDVCISPEGVRLHPPAPDGPEIREVFAGDLVTFEIKAHNVNAVGSSPLTVAVYLGSPPDLTPQPPSLSGTAEKPAEIARGQFGPADLSGQSEALFTWAWNTTGISGTQTLSIVLDPDHALQEGDPDRSNDIAQIQVEVRPADERPAREIGAHWAQTETTCCIFHYVTGTAAERDLEALTRLANASIAEVEAALGENLEEKLVVTFLGRVLGHGGYATGELILSYLDRDYAGGGREEVFLHEGTHVIDRNFAPARLTMLAEGLAVYVAGGHFRAEPLPERAAALLAIGRYIPLRQLADDFYKSQHEIGYLEAGAFTHYLVNTYGLERFKAFYGSFQGDDRRPQSEQLDAALKESFGLGLEDMEQRWLDALKALGSQPAQERDLRDTIAFYDAVRRYQQAMDPTAYFLDAWLPDFNEARKRNVVADALRHPMAPENIALETMLIAADAHFDAQEYEEGERLLDSINAVLDTVEEAGAMPDLEDPLAAQYLGIVKAVSAAGYEPQQIRLDGPTAEVKAIRLWPALVELDLQLRAGKWVVTND